MAGDKRFVYVLRNSAPRFYIGLTSDVNARLADHNWTLSTHGISPTVAASRRHRVLG
jgi:predicted GIY-YIG superfamily endonuclease